MIAGRVDAMDGGERTGDAQGARRHLLEWLEGGQDILTQVSRLCDDLEQSRAAAAAADRECARLRDDVALLRRDNDALTTETARLAGELARLRADTASLEAEAATVRNHNAALMDERGATAKLIADKLEDMLAQVLPRLARSGPAPAEVQEPRPRAQAAAPAPAPPVAASPVAPPPSSPMAPSLAAPAPTEVSPDAAAVVARSEAPAPAARSLAEPEMRGVTPAMELLDEEPYDEAGGAGEQVRVLVVDDETDFTELLRDHLGGGGYAVVVASSGEDALGQIEVFQPRVVLLDMMMAGIGGMETLRRIKASRPETSVIMITALDDRDVARKALAAGAADYLTKPLSLDFLDSALAVHAAGPLPISPQATVELVTVAAPAQAARRTFFARA